MFRVQTGGSWPGTADHCSKIVWALVSGWRAIVLYTTFFSWVVFVSLSPHPLFVYLFIYLKLLVLLWLLLHYHHRRQHHHPLVGFFLFPPVIKIFLSQSTACGGEFLLWFSCKEMYVMCFWRVFCSFCSSRSDLAVLTHISPMGLVYKTPSKCVV